MLHGHASSKDRNMDTLEGKVAVITGAASGIGLALARACAAGGMRLVLADIEAAALANAAAQLRGAGAVLSSLVTDVSQDDAVATLAAHAWQEFGAVHLLCNNAGVFAGGLCWEASDADYRWVLGVNLWGVIHGIRHFVPRMIAQGGAAHIVNVASMAGYTAMPFAGVYHTSKHAVAGLSECLYHDLALNAPQIGVTLVCPEMVNTGIGNAVRNRPADLSRPGDIPDAPARIFVEDTIRAAAQGGIDPAVIAARTLDAVRARRFYVFGEGPWREAANSRLEDIATGRNPLLVAPA
jgi:NAD(P)-dependent dehydrogenase (short-subunit alcohol dehydrogenase family)